MPTDNDLTQRVARVLEHIMAGRLDQAAYGLSKIPHPANTQPEVMIVGAMYEFRSGRAANGLALGHRAYSALPDDPEIACHLASMLWLASQKQQAIHLLQQHHARHSTHTLVIRLLSDLYHRAGLMPQSNAMFAKLVKLEPPSTEMLFVRAYQAMDLRLHEQALELFELASSQAPADRRAGEGHLFALLFAGAPPEQVRRVSQAWCQAKYANVTPARLPPRAHNPHHKLRVGYVSGDFRSHVVMYFMEGILRAHDRSRVSVHCYATSDKHDHVTDRVRAASDSFTRIHTLSDDDAADLIRRDQIDVLVDLSGHTESHRLGLFARRAAPVQASYLGYPATTGLAEMDYKISDALADPPGVETHYTEKLWRLPRCAWAFHLPDDEAQSSERETKHPDQSQFTFASFNLLSKVSRSSVSLWGRMLRQVADINPSARLLMTDRRGLLANRDGVEQLTREFAETNVDVSRIVLASWLPRPEQQRQRYREVDVMLDPLTYNGTTTTCEALWHGVPTLTLASTGASHVSRVGYSLLTAVGLTDFIATSEQDFISRAKSLAQGRFDLPSLRPTLRQRLQNSPLGDFTTLARALEDAYAQMLHEKLTAPAH